MLSGKQAHASVVLFAALVLPACGAESPSSPTPSYSERTDIVSVSGFGGSPTACQKFNNAKAGPVTVFVTPPAIHLVLRTGTCNAPGQILAEQDTELVKVSAPAGSNHVRLSNPSQSDTPYMLRLTYWH